MESLPDAFVDRMTEVLGSRERLDELLEARTRPAARVNPLKTTPSEARRRLEALGLDVEPVPFAQGAFFLEDPEEGERALGTIFEHQAGHLFLQDPASLLPVQALDPQPGDRVLDLCAAPGSKTTHIAERLGQEGLLVANDRNPGRLNNLISNLDRTGALTAIVVQADGSRLRWPLSFDKVLVDAPCTNLGSMHASWTPVRRFSPGRVRQLQGLQKGLLRSAFHAARVGGTIAYSTCTVEPAENEAVASWFLETFPVEPEPVRPGIGEPGLVEVAGERFDPGVEAACRVWAGEHDTEGFFVARFRKTDTAPFEDGRAPHWGAGEIELADEPGLGDIVDAYGLDPGPLEDAVLARTASRLYASTAPGLEDLLELSPKRAGVYLATPEPHGPRLSFEAATLLGRGAKRTIELSPEEARTWLSGETVPLDRRVEETWSVVTCLGEPLGCARPFGPKLPCYVPKRFRVPDEGPPRIGFLASEGL